MTPRSCLAAKRSTPLRLLALAAALALGAPAIADVNTLEPAAPPSSRFT